MITSPPVPGLFGLEHSNRDFTKKPTWGKNQFNSSFPASLACYMGSQEINPVYLTLDDAMNVKHSNISTQNLFGLKELSTNLHFAFETQYVPFSPLVIGSLPRTDLVTMKLGTSPSTTLRGLEVKLTALPDNQTCDLKEDKYGSEIVVRPDTIVYLAASIATLYKTNRVALFDRLDPICGPIKEWDDPAEVHPLFTSMVAVLNELLIEQVPSQSAFLMQPIWKTVGKSPVLSDNCLDLFIWSDLAFTRLFIESGFNERSVTRSTRTLFWLMKMLYEFARDGRFNHKAIIDQLTYNAKNDKAFAVGGLFTHKFMHCDELTRPRVQKEAMRSIILGDGQNFLSPERRFDAAIVGTPGLFEYHSVAQSVEGDTESEAA